jgi:hypothetical protein
MFLLQEKHISEEIKNLHVLRIYTYYCKLDSRFKHSRRFLWRHFRQVWVNEWLFIYMFGNYERISSHYINKYISHLFFMC